ncbi:Isochorismatase-like protein [Apodospora peruviana]|uniref:Isochorismatase-like protein n=1 Tax=Apodospora peruviana TaxID=516989 RepID=A0AAE0M0G2_9PEZI|nr:Isochorismatase-like protein [Apodospora peruviana]
MAATALFVIDIQNDLAKDPNTRITHAERIKTAGKKILTAARALIDNKTGPTDRGGGMTCILFVQHEEDPEAGALVRGTEPWKLVFEPRAAIDREILVAKTTRDTFESNPNLADNLKAHGVEEVVVFGIQSECCVESTCRGVLRAGFGVTVLSGAHSTYDTKEKSAVEIEREVEGRLQEGGAKVVGWEEAVAVWEREGKEN